MCGYAVHVVLFYTCEQVAEASNRSNAGTPTSDGQVKYTISIVSTCLFGLLYLLHTHVGNHFFIEERSEVQDVVCVEVFTFWVVEQRRGHGDSPYTFRKNNKHYESRDHKTYSDSTVQGFSFLLQNSCK